MGKTVQIAHQHRAGEWSAERFSGAETDNRQGDSQGYRAVSAQSHGDGSNRHRHGATASPKGGAHACRIAIPDPSTDWTPYLAKVLCPEAGKNPLFLQFWVLLLDFLLTHLAKCHFSDSKGLV